MSYKKIREEEVLELVELALAHSDEECGCYYCKVLRLFAHALKNAHRFPKTQQRCKKIRPKLKVID